MELHDQPVGSKPAGSQSTKIPHFFRQLHTRVSGLLPFSKKQSEFEQSSLVKDSPPRFLSPDTDVTSIPNPEAQSPVSSELGYKSARLNGYPQPPASAIARNRECGLDSEPAIQDVQADRMHLLSFGQSPEDTDVDHLNWENFKKPNTGVLVKRKATELQDGAKRRRDESTTELLLSTSHCSTHFTESQALGGDPNDNTLRGGVETVIKTDASAKNLIVEKSSSCIYDSSALVESAVSDSPEVYNIREDLVKDDNAPQNLICKQVPPFAREDIVSDSCVQDGPPCREAKEPRVLAELGRVSEEGLSENFSNAVCDVVDDIDSQSSSFSCRRSKKDLLSVNKWSLPVGVQGDLFSLKLKEVLDEPVDLKQLSEMWEVATRRKPLLKLRQTRGRIVHVTTNDEGLSYIDHHPDLARRLEESLDPPEKLTLLRGFFFWLQHSCMEGAYKPWVPKAKDRDAEDDCMFTDGPDCEVLAVVLPLDEKKDVSSLVKDIDPIVIDLGDDDDEDNVPTATVHLPSEADQNTKADTCLNCVREFGMEKDRQRALYTSCGHIGTCVSCVNELWKQDKKGCPTCGFAQVKKPKSILDFAESDGESDMDK